MKSANTSTALTRLNPKLTKRAKGPMPSIGFDSARSDTSGSSEGSYTGSESTDSAGGLDIEVTNPRINMMHNGVWIKKLFEVGRHVPNTGVWSCCGDAVKLSMYCESFQERVDYKDGLRRVAEEAVEEVEKSSKRRADLLGQIKAAENQSEPLPATLTREERAIEEACREEGGFNAPMLVSWLLSHHHEEPTAINGLKYLGKHMATGEGCFLMLRHGALEAVLKIHEFYQNQPPVQLLVIKVLRQLLDCNYTRTLVVSKAAVLSACFAIAHHHMNSPPHLEIAVHCIAQTARSEVCRREILRQNILPYMLNFCKRFSKSAKILRPALMLLLRVCTDQARLEHVCALHGVNTAIQCIRRHPSNALIVSPAILFLARAGQNHPPSMELLLQKNAAALVVEALKLVYSDAPIQLEGLKLLQIIAKTSQGWKQISAVHAGWQSICQGTNPGDALVHSLPGAFQNPGWAIGDTPFLPLLDRQKIAASKLGQSSLQTEPSAAWTPLSLREFMGLSVTGQVLSINTEQPRVFFELVSTLDMLPLSGEEREAWFQRVHAYEQESEVKIEDMVKTVQEMRRREALKKKMELKGLNVGAYSDEVLGTVKEVYVNGVRITSEYLQTRDADVEETLQGIA